MKLNLSVLQLILPSNSWRHLYILVKRCMYTHARHSSRTHSDAYIDDLCTYIFTVLYHMQNFIYLSILSTLLYLCVQIFVKHTYLVQRYIYSYSDELGWKTIFAVSKNKKYMKNSHFFQVIYISHHNCPHYHRQYYPILSI